MKPTTEVITAMAQMEHDSRWITFLSWLSAELNAENTVMRTADAPEVHRSQGRGIILADILHEAAIAQDRLDTITKAPKRNMEDT